MYSALIPKTEFPYFFEFLIFFQIVSLVYLSKFQEKVHLMTGTLHCPLINLPADFFETVLILQSNESHAIISIYTHPFDLAQGSVGVGNSVLNASHAVDLKYDYGRRQIVVLFVSIAQLQRNLPTAYTSVK